LFVHRHDENDKYGAIAVTDITNMVVAKNLSFDRVNVYKTMWKPTLTLHPSTSIRYVSISQTS
jgi:hypothetical protein